MPGWVLQAFLGLLSQNNSVCVCVHFLLIKVVYFHCGKFREFRKPKSTINSYVEKQSRDLGNVNKGWYLNITPKT